MANDPKRSAQRVPELLKELKEMASYRPPHRSASRAGDGDDESLLPITPETVVDAYLLRYLGAAAYSTEEALVMLKRRRDYERTLGSVSVSPEVLLLLSCGVISVIGRDLRGRQVVYLNLQRFSAALCLDEENMIRLTTVVMEYIHALCISSMTDASASSLAGLKNGDNTERMQQCVLLVNEESVEWEFHLPLLAHISAVTTVLSKYYPHVMGLVLLVGANFDVRQGIKDTLHDSPREVKALIHLVQRNDLNRYIDRHVTPTELGGSLTVPDRTTTFADAVLRHWYALLCYAQLETMSARGSATESGISARSVAEPSPSLIYSEEQWKVQRKYLMMSTALNSRTLAIRQSHNIASEQAATGAGGDGSMHTGARAADVFTNFDEGLCSALSVDEYSMDEYTQPRSPTQRSAGVRNNNNNNNASFSPSSSMTAAAKRAVDGSLASAAVVLPLSEEEEAKIRANSDYAVQALQKERSRRMQAEQQVHLLEMGVVMDVRNMSMVERSLAAMHEEMNVLVSNILVRASAARARDAPPSLAQLLQLTVSSLEAASGTREEVPAMSLAQPAIREPPQSCCPCM